ncbi:hypothetical protein C8R44DRAFT_726825 [Mycena epipterygia]|nr:hypothetical protein C8R44DRAFT_726825 [Mycena epipterygia]
MCMLLQHDHKSIKGLFVWLIPPADHMLQTHLESRCQSGGSEVAVVGMIANKNVVINKLAVTEPPRANKSAWRPKQRIREKDPRRFRTIRCRLEANSHEPKNVYYLVSVVLLGMIHGSSGGRNGTRECLTGTRACRTNAKVSTSGGEMSVESGGVADATTGSVGRVKGEQHVVCIGKGSPQN